MRETEWIFPAELDTDKGLKTLKVRRGKFGEFDFSLLDECGMVTLGAYSPRQKDWTMKTQYWSLSLKLDEFIENHEEIFTEEIN